MELQRRSERAPILTNSDQCLLLYPYEDWCAFEERIVGLNSFDPDVLAYGRMMISGASECPITRREESWCRRCSESTPGSNARR